MNHPRPAPGRTVDLDPLLDATRTINAIIVRSLATADEELTVPQLRVLVILTALRGASLSEVADDLGVNPSNASRTCDQRVRRGLVGPGRGPHGPASTGPDPRPRGTQFLQRVIERRRELLAVVVGAMTPEAQGELLAAMVSFNAAAAATGAVRLTTTDPAAAHALARSNRAVQSEGFAAPENHALTARPITNAFRSRDP